MYNSTIWDGSLPLPDLGQAAGMVGALALMHLLTVWLRAFFLRRSILKLIS